MNQKEFAERLYKFALRVVKFVRKLPKEMAVREISGQLIRAATSIAANYEEASVSFSKEEFTYKISICFKEAKESNLWVRLLRDIEINLSSDMKTELIFLTKESFEITNIFGKSVKTAKLNLKSKKENKMKSSKFYILHSTFNFHRRWLGYVKFKI